MSDPLWDHVTLHLPFDGSDGDTATVDESPQALAITFAGGAEISTAQSKWGGSSLKVPDDSASWLLAPNSSAVLDIAGDYSIQFWMWIDPATPSGVSGYALSTFNDDANFDGIEIKALTIGSVDVVGQIELVVWGVDGRAIIRTTNFFNNPIPLGQWVYVEVSRDGNAHRIFLDGVLAIEQLSISRPVSSSDPWIQIGGSNDGWGSFPGYLDDFRITNGVARNTAAYTPPTSPHPIVVPQPDARISMPAPGSGMAACALVADAARAMVPSPLPRPAAYALNDFTGLISDPTERYIMRITGDPPVEVPISSWQATVQDDRASFLQCVVPAVGDYTDTITARQGVEQMVIYRQTTIGGQAVESEMARADLSSVIVSRGPTRETGTLSGYTDAFTSPVSASTVQLQGVRSSSQTIGGSARVRASIDWLLRPGQVVTDGTISFTAGYINYFVPTVGDAYMDVGSRG